MPKKLKVYKTSIGFYDLIVATQSMKAALEAWGAASNLFHQGFAEEADDRAAVAAAKEKPGIVLRRPIGTNKPFSESTDVPDDLPAEKPRAPRKPKRPSKRNKEGNDAVAARRAVAADEKQRRKDEADRKRVQQREAQARERRDAAIEKAQAQLDDARSKHDEAISALEAERDKIAKRIDQQDQRWVAQEQKLEAAIKRAKKL